MRDQLHWPNQGESSALELSVDTGLVPLHVNGALEPGETIVAVATFLKSKKAYTILREDGGTEKSLNDDSQGATLKVVNGIYQVADENPKRVHWSERSETKE
jgi:hypothetical protein